MPIHIQIPHLVLSAFVVLAFATAARAQQAATPPAGQTPQRLMPRVFLDCNRCDEDHIRKEVTFVDYVRHAGR